MINLEQYCDEILKHVTLEIFIEITKNKLKFVNYGTHCIIVSKYNNDVIGYLSDDDFKLAVNINKSTYNPVNEIEREEQLRLLTCIYHQGITSILKMLIFINGCSVLCSDVIPSFTDEFSLTYNFTYRYGVDRLTINHHDVYIASIDDTNTFLTEVEINDEIVSIDDLRKRFCYRLHIDTYYIKDAIVKARLSLYLQKASDNILRKWVNMINVIHGGGLIDLNDTSESQICSIASFIISTYNISLDDEISDIYRIVKNMYFIITDSLTEPRM